MLISLRKGVGSWFAKIFIGLLVLSFAVWGVADFLTNRSATALASIEGRDIQPGEYQREFQRELYRLQRRFGPEFDSQQARAAGLDREVLRQMLTRVMFDTRAEELGLATPDAVVAETIRTSPTFRDPFGAFDRFAFERALRENGYTEADFVERTRGELTRRQLIAAITAGAEPSQQLAETLYRYRNEKRVLEILAVPQSAVGKLPTPSEAELNTFYDENPRLFTAPEYRSATYIALTPKELTGEITIDEADLQESYEDRLPEFTIIGERDLEQFVLSDRARADDAASRIEAGEDFHAIAKEYADVSPEDMRLRGITRQELLPEVADAIFELEKSQISRPLESPLGWQIVRIVDMKKGRTKGFEEVREQLVDDIAQERASDALYELINQFEDARGSGDSLEEAAAAIGATTRYIDAIDRSGNDTAGQKVNETPSSPEFLADIFESEQGDENDLRETDDGGFFVVRVDSITPSATRPYDEVHADIVSAWQAQAIGEALQEIADEIRTEANAGQPLSDIATARGLTITPTEPIGRDYQDSQLGAALVSEIFTAKQGQHVSGAVPAGGYAVVRVREIVAPTIDETEVAFNRTRNQLETSIADELLTQYQMVLEQRYELRIDQNQLASLFDAP